MKRPDGSIANGIGGILIAIGIVAIFVVASAETPIAFQIGLLTSYLGLGLGVLLCSVAYLVRAIWFLPGREIERDLGATEWEDSTTDCEYCELAITAPAQPCSAVPADDLPSMIDRIDDDKCLRILRAQGILPKTEPT